MSVDLSQFIPGFLEESHEGLQVMETSLLALTPGDNETINEVFRAAHSIKGGAGTFGFSGVAEFTHEAETLLDAMRNGTVEVTSTRTDLLLQSVDVIRDLLERAADGDNSLPPEAEALASALSQAQSDSEPSSDVPDERQTTPVAPAADAEPQARGWQIAIKADPGLLTTGNDPIFLFQALADLGPLRTGVVSDALPSLEQLEPEQLYLRWQLQLDSDCSEDAIREVFEWVEDDVELAIQPAADLTCSDQSGADEGTQGWQIQLHPGEDLLHTGNDPLLLLASLAELGQLEAKVSTERLPELSMLDPAALYLDWSLTLHSDCDESAIREVFEWVEDEVELTLTPLGSPREAEEAEVAEKTPTDTATPQDGSEERTPVPVVETPQTSTPAAAPSPAAPAAAPAGVAKKSAVRESSIRVDTGKVDSLVDRVGELVITQAMLLEVSQALADIEHPAVEELQKGLLQLERNTRELQEDVMRIRMLPISFVFNRFPRLVHDVSQQLGKQVELHLQGEHTELDKTVLEKIGDPLVHLVRNGLDHGLEGPEERQASGKERTGHLWLTASQQGGNIMIEIRDDGRGLNRSRIRSKAIERGLIDAHAQLSDQEVDELIFLPGFSTAEQVSDLSGRGVGMDVVRRNIESLGGNIELVSTPGAGSRFTIRLPLTLAIMDGQLVRLDKDPYVIPLISIVETLQATSEMLVSMAGNRCLLHFRDEYLPLIRLTSTFGLQPSTQPLQPGCIVVVVENSGQKAGLVVDELMGQQQTVIKSLEQNYRRVPGLSGATILGDGSVALILDVAGLINRSLDADTALIARQKNEQQEVQA